MALVNCQDVQTVLYESFGVSELPAGVREHVQNCPECRALHAELSAVRPYLGDDTGHFPSDIERGTILARINARIDAIEEPRAGFWHARLQWVLPVAASVALLLGLALFGGGFQTEPTASIDSLLIAELDPEVSEEELALYDDLDESTVRALLRDYSSGAADEPSGLLLDDLTDDEYEYLAKNFDVGEIL